MERTKDQFLAMRAEEVEQLNYAQDFTKKQAKQTGQDLAKQILDRGEKRPEEVMAALVRLTEVINTAQTELKKNLTFDKAESLNGVTFEKRNSGDRLDYEKDVEYARLKTLLKQREDLLKKATKSDDEVIDPNTGEVIKPVPVKTHGKETVVIKF